VRAFFIYLICLVVSVEAMNLIVGMFFSTSYADATLLAYMGAISIFDFKIANPRWSMFRRIFPSVKWRHLLVWCLPIMNMELLLIAPTFQQEHTIAFFSLWIVSLIVMPIYLLTQLYSMREGSRDDLSWFYPFNGLKWRERFERYLGIFEGKTS